MIIELKAVPEMERAGAKAEGDSLTVEPLFWKPNEVVNAASVVVKDSSGKTLFTGMLKVSGQSGKLTLLARTQPVTPTADAHPGVFKTSKKG